MCFPHRSSSYGTKRCIPTLVLALLLFTSFGCLHAQSVATVDPVLTQLAKIDAIDTSKMNSDWLT
ncbi:MAG TPA: hypothetical protein VF135_06720, partial [Terriglobales bacterium]